MITLAGCRMWQNLRTHVGASFRLKHEHVRCDAERVWLHLIPVQIKINL